METALFLSQTRSAPVYITVEQHAELQRFIAEEPSQTPQALVFVGTSKSGKSTLLNRVLPGMLAAAHATHRPRTRRRPVIFQHQFWNTESSAGKLHSALEWFGREINIPFGDPREQTPTAALGALPRSLKSFAQRIHDCGGELWLLMDGVLGSCQPVRAPPTLAQSSMHMLQQVRRPAVCRMYACCSACAPVVIRWVEVAA